jgi:tripartite-type tricarboxylate transporter receptor subunit TctC
MGRFGRILLQTFCLVVTAAAQAPAQSAYPAKPIRIIVPYAPGGLTDVVARLYAEQLRQSFGRGVFVENKPGASGIIAIEEMARAKPDGYMLMIGNISTNGLTPVLLAKRMKVDYERDVQVITPLADVPVFFLATTTAFASDGFSPKTFAEFLDYARAHPGKVRYGSAGIGSYQQVNTEILKKRAGLDLVHIPFKGGGAEIIRDLANGDIHVSWFNITNPVGMMKAGRVRACDRVGRTAAAACRRAHPDRGRLSRHPRRAMGGRLRTGRGAARDRRHRAQGLPEGDDRARDAGGLCTRWHAGAAAILAGGSQGLAA